MKIDYIYAKRFGCFKNWESPELEKGLIIIYGKNESGKSTLFNMISTILYGYHPASRELNPYVPWEADEAECSCRLTLDDGQRIEVTRKLRYRPEGTMIRSNKIINLGNGPVPYIASLPWEIFDEIYALTIEDLCFPDGRLWEKIQDQLLGGQYASFLKPVSQVVKEIDNEANSLWRDDNRGKPQTKLVAKRLLELEHRLKDAYKNEQELRKIERDLNEKNDYLNNLVLEKGQLLDRMDWYNTVYPIKKTYKRIEELFREAGEGAPFDDLPSDIEKTLDVLYKRRDELKEEYSRLNIGCNQIENVLSRITDRDRLIYEKKDAISAISKSYEQAEMDNIGYIQMEQKLHRLSDKLNEESSQILSGGWRADFSGKIQNIDMAALRSNIYAYKKLDNDYKEALSILHSFDSKVLGGRFTSSLIYVSSSFLIMGVLGIAFLGNSPMGFASAFLGVLGLGGIGYWCVQKGGVSKAVKKTDDIQKQISYIQEKKSNIIETIRIILKNIPIHEDRINFPDETLILDMNKLKDITTNINDVLMELDQISSRILKRESYVAEILDYCKIENTGDVLKNITILENALDKSQQKLIQEHELLSEMGDKKRAISDVNSSLLNINNQIDDIIKRLDFFEGQDMREKIRNIKNKRQCYYMACNMEQELRQRYLDLDEIISDKENSFLDCEKEGIDNGKMQARLSQLEDRINVVTGEMGALKKELEYRQSADTIDNIKGEMEALKIKRNDIAIARDKLILIKNIILESDKCFRETHQPDVLKRAARYLNIITAGKYNKVFAMQYDKPGIGIMGDHLAHPLPVDEHLSTGTQEQLYLSLRLALMEHMDVQNNILPLFMDEVLVNWDGTRIKNGIDILAELSKKRQIFLFSCHDWLVDMVKSHMHAQIVELN